MRKLPKRAKPTKTAFASPTTAFSGKSHPGRNEGWGPSAGIIVLPLFARQIAQVRSKLDDLARLSLDRLVEALHNRIRLGLSERFFEHVAQGLHRWLVLKVRPALVRNGEHIRPRRAAVHQFVESIVDRPLGLRSEEHTSELQSQSNLVCRL